jgi:hypothetical protein
MAAPIPRLPPATSGRPCSSGRFIQFLLSEFQVFADAQSDLAEHSDRMVGTSPATAQARVVEGSPRVAGVPLCYLLTA